MYRVGAATCDCQCFGPAVLFDTHRMLSSCSIGVHGYVDDQRVTAAHTDAAVVGGVW